MRPMLKTFTMLLVLALVAGAGAAVAQTTTATIRGTVTDAQGGVPGATVTALNTENGARISTLTAVGGTYAVKVPPGSYEVTVKTGAHQPFKKAVRALIGQDVALDIPLLPGKVEAVATVVGTAEAIPELKTTEIATNVTENQIQSLPQPTRNFLYFAALAPGVRNSHDELRQEISYGAQGAVNTNVFIDGTSYKNDVLQGGVVGQDSSRGNPFPQNAVQEYRVITQNYKAEYQKASSVIISAVTKSGGNELHGDAFLYYQDKNLVAQDKFSAQAGLEKPEYTRYQPGLSIGGPIVKDKFHFFGSYEGNYQNRENSVYLGSDMNWNASFRNQFQKYVGNYQSPFRGSLAFVKGSANLAEGSTLDVSGDWRHETDIRDFGNQQSYENANDIKNDIYTVRAKHTGLFGNLMNEATVSFQQYEWNPTPPNVAIVGQNYQGLMQIGGKDTIQDFTQQRLAIRDDVTLLNAKWAGDHVVKGGLTYDYLKYHVIKQLNYNPVYNYRPATYATTQGDMPFQAVYGSGNPDLSATNNQFGAYIQDDWRINNQLTVNLGLRWDFESDMLNNDYVTPQVVRDGLSKVYPSNYFTDGTNRPTYYGAIQPRIGLSYDVTGKGKTIAYGGYGKYYDRTLFNDILDEKFRLQWQVRTFWFSKDGSPQDGNPAIKWDPSYLSRAALDQLIAKGVAPAPEIFLLDNNTKPPSSDQWSVGIRHNFGTFNASFGYMGVYSQDQLTWTCGIKAADGSCDWGARPAAAQGLGFSMLSRGKETWLDSFQLNVEKPFTGKWGGFVSYAYSDAKQTGNDLFSWGKMDPVNGTKQTSPIAQKHQITASAIVGLPAGFKASTLVSMGSGYPFYVTDCSKGYDKCVESIGGGTPGKWTQSIDFRIDWEYKFAQSFGLGLSVEAINLFNYVNEQYYDGWVPALPDVNAHFGQAGGAYNPRRIQFGVRFTY